LTPLGSSWPNGVSRVFFKTAGGSTKAQDLYTSLPRRSLVGGARRSFNKAMRRGPVLTPLQLVQATVRAYDEPRPRQPDMLQGLGEFALVPFAALELRVGDEQPCLRSLEGEDARDGCPLSRKPKVVGICKTPGNARGRPL
jgi:hypothetical protein